MRLTVKDMDIATGGVLVVVLHEVDARKLDLHPEDRVKLKFGAAEVVAAIDIAESERAVPRGKIGCFEEVLAALNTKEGDVLELSPERKPESVAHIKAKLDGKQLTKAEIGRIVNDLVENKLTDTELTYFIAASYTHGLSINEIVELTKAMIATGDRLELGRRPLFDLHCTGGVPGNRTTLITVPIVVAAGLTVPKTSSRSITSPAGTADTMEVLCNVALSLERIKEIVLRVGGCIVWGGALRLAPADDKIIKVENPLSIDAEGNMLSSIMAKKGAMGISHVLLDLPIGPTAKLASRAVAEKLAKDFVTIGKRLGIGIKVIYTDGSQPIGNGIGPLLEARDALWILRNDPRGPADLREKAIKLAAVMLEMAGKPGALARQLLEKGIALEKALEIIRAQGARAIDPEKLFPGEHSFDFCAPRAGVIRAFDNRIISKIARLAGAPQDKEAGIFLHHHLGAKVKRGDKIYTVYAKSDYKLEFALEVLRQNPGVMLR